MNNDDELYDDEEILDLEDDSSSEDFMNAEEEYVDDTTGSVSQVKSQKEQHGQSLDNTMDGSKMTQKTGVPKSSVDAATKENGETSSQANLPQGKNDNHFRNKISNISSKNALNSNKNDSSRLQQALHRNQFSNASKSNATNRENVQNEKEQSQNKALQTGASLAAQFVGIPKPIADTITSGITVDKLKKQLMIKILVACLPMLIVILVPLLVLAGDNNSHGEQDTPNEEEKTYKGEFQITSSGFAKRIGRALRNNDYFYNDNASNEGECAWYAVRRTNEILGMAGISKRVSSGGNGADFCYSNDYQSFKHVYDINSLKPGMVISWSGGDGHNYGHVAIIEDVYYDIDGKVEHVDISESSNSSGTGYNTFIGVHKITNNYIWGLPEGSYKKQIRQYNCEGSLNGSTGTGCQTFVSVPASQLNARWSSYKFVCGIDLLS